MSSHSYKDKEIYVWQNSSFEHFVLFFIHIVINNLISDEQPCKMEQLKWNLINNNKSNDNNNNNNGDDNNNDTNNIIIIIIII